MWTPTHPSPKVRGGFMLQSGSGQNFHFWCKVPTSTCYTLSWVALVTFVAFAIEKCVSIIISVWPLDKHPNKLERCLQPWRNVTSRSVFCAVQHTPKHVFTVALPSSWVTLKPLSNSVLMQLQPVNHMLQQSGDWHWRHSNWVKQKSR